MFQFPAYALSILTATGLQPDGLPHSDISGSIPVCRSPELFAAYHVLPRFRKPRHPPFALILFLVLSKWIFATFTSQIFTRFAFEIAVPISQLEKTRICYSYTDYNLFLTSLPRYLSQYCQWSLKSSLWSFPHRKGRQRYTLFLNLQIFSENILKKISFPI